jgi:hypothetical protein
MDEERLRETVIKLRTLSARLRYAGPQTDDELYNWIVKEFGIRIPRVSVCPDHIAPFQFLADIFFERVASALALANRGGAKTFLVALLHYLNCTFKPGCQCLTFGATEPQGQRCYAHIEDWCYEHDEETGRRLNVIKPFIEDKPLKSHTKWRTGGMVEVVAGSVNAVSGGHQSKVHADELDLMEPAVWNQSRGIAVSNPASGELPPFMSKFNGMIPPQDIVTSTRNSVTGLMQELLDEIADDIKNGDVPQFELFIWCIWECVQEVPSCRNAPKDKREARLKELDRDPSELCNCDRVPKGYHPDGKRRTLQDSCGRIGKTEKGHEYKGFRARGWKPYGDLIQTFKRNTPGTWTLQHECRTGRSENSYIDDWSLARYGIRNYEPHPMYGPIYMGVDWGADNPAAVLWFQYLTSEVPALDFDYQPIFLAPKGYVLFREVYVSGLSSDNLADRVLRVEREYHRKFGAGWQVKNRFCDPQGKGDRITFANRGLKSSWPIKTRNKEQFILSVQNIVTDDRFSVDVEGAPAFCMEIEQWQKNPRTNKEVPKNNHAMSAWRYAIANAEILEGRARHLEGDDNNRQERNESSGRKRKNTIFIGGTPVKNYGGGIAASGSTQVPLSDRFSLGNVK